MTCFSRNISAEVGSPTIPVEWLNNEITGNGIDDNAKGFIDEELASLFGQYQKLHLQNEITVGVGVQTINLEVLKRMRRRIKKEKFEMTFRLLQ